MSNLQRTFSEAKMSSLFSLKAFIKRLERFATVTFNKQKLGLFLILSKSLHYPFFAAAISCALI
jgi:hypothetical protein